MEELAYSVVALGNDLHITPFLHDRTARPVRLASLVRGRQGGHPRNIFKDLAHQLPRQGRTLGVAITAHLLRDAIALFFRINQPIGFSFNWVPSITPLQKGRR